MSETRSFEIRRRNGDTHRVLIDSADVLLVVELNWCVLRPRGSRTLYAIARPGGACVLLHRLLLGAPPGMQVDHINANGLDNRRVNLRTCTPQQNAWNVARQRNNTSGFKGVWLTRATGRYRASVKHNGRSIHVGYFDTPEEAHCAYAEAAASLQGEFARTA